MKRRGIDRNKIRVTELRVSSHSIAIVRAFDPIAKVVIHARTEPVEEEGPDDSRIEVWRSLFRSGVKNGENNGYSNKFAGGS